MEGQALPSAPEIWLANDALRTGTSLFYQYRGQPRIHTFDINAATEFDWRTVPGVSALLAQRLLAGAPYASVDDLIGRPEVPASLGLWSIAWGYLWRFGVFLIVASVPGAWLGVRKLRRLRNGTTRSSPLPAT